MQKFNAVRHAIFIAMLISLSVSSFGQSGHRFKFALGSGFGAYPVMGPMMFAEPSFQLNERLMISGRIEGILGTDILRNGNTGVGSYGLQVSRFFPSYQDSFRPFAGIGIHRYHIGTGIGMIGDGHTDIEPQLGVNPRLGFHYRHLFMALEFNAVFRTTRTSYSTIPSPIPPTIYSDQVQLNYWCIKIGVLLHAGKQP